MKKKENMKPELLTIVTEDHSAVLLWPISSSVSLLHTIEPLEDYLTSNKHITKPRQHAQLRMSTSGRISSAATKRACRVAVVVASVPLQVCGIRMMRCNQPSWVIVRLPQDSVPCRATSGDFKTLLVLPNAKIRRHCNIIRFRALGTLVRLKPPAHLTTCTWRYLGK